MAVKDEPQVDDRSEYAAEVTDRLARRSARTSDFDDPSVGWTAQQGAAPVEVSGEPAPYALEQLPDPAVAIAAGLPPQTIPSNLIGGVDTPRNEGGHTGVDPYRHPGVDLGDQANVTAEDQADKYEELRENPTLPGNTSFKQTPAVPGPEAGVDEPAKRPTAKAQSSTPGSTDAKAGASETNK